MLLAELGLGYCPSLAERLTLDFEARRKASLQVAAGAQEIDGCCWMVSDGWQIDQSA